MERMPTLNALLPLQAEAVVELEAVEEVPVGARQLQAQAKPVQLQLVLVVARAQRNQLKKKLLPRKLVVANQLKT